eukprot:Opistho-2@57565
MISMAGLDEVVLTLNKPRTVRRFDPRCPSTLPLGPTYASFPSGPATVLSLRRPNALSSDCIAPSNDKNRFRRRAFEGSPRSPSPSNAAAAAAAAAACCALGCCSPAGVSGTAILGLRGVFLPLLPPSVDGRGDRRLPAACALTCPGVPPSRPIESRRADCGRTARNVLPLSLPVLSLRLTTDVMDVTDVTATRLLPLLLLADACPRPSRSRRSCSSRSFSMRICATAFASTAPMDGRRCDGTAASVNARSGCGGCCACDATPGCLTTWPPDVDADADADWSAWVDAGGVMGTPVVLIDCPLFAHAVVGPTGMAISPALVPICTRSSLSFFSRYAAVAWDMAVIASR